MTKEGIKKAKQRGATFGFASHVNPQDSQKRATEASHKSLKANADAFAENLREQVTMMRSAGKSLDQIAESFNRMGIKTPRDGEWHAMSISRLIKRLEGSTTRLTRCDKKT